MLEEGQAVNDISLRELSRRVGLSKSNVTRYFDSREAVFLELFDEECRSYLSELADSLGAPRRQKANYANEIRVATLIAETLVKRHLLCDLMSAMAGVLERNISVQFARDFKARSAENLDALADLIARQLPWIDPAFTALFAEGALALTAGMYPFSNPTAAVAQALSEIGQADPRERFTSGLRENLSSWLIGFSVRSETTRAQSARRA